MRTGVVAAAVATAVLAGCAGSAEPSSGPEVLADVVATLEAAGSVRVEGLIGNSSDHYDLHAQGDDAVGTTSLGADDDAPFVAVDGEAYLLPPDNLLTDLGATEEEAAPFRGRYVILPDDGWRENMPGSLAAVIDLLPSREQVLDKVEESSLDGEPVWVLTAEDGRKLTVDARAPHHPLRLLVPAETDEGTWGDPEHTIRFSDVGERRSVEAPDDPIPADQIWG